MYCSSVLILDRGGSVFFWTKQWNRIRRRGGCSYLARQARQARGIRPPNRSTSHCTGHGRHKGRRQLRAILPVVATSLSIGEGARFPPACLCRLLLRSPHQRGWSLRTSPALSTSPNCHRTLPFPHHRRGTAMIICIYIYFTSRDTSFPQGSLKLRLTTTKTGTWPHFKMLQCGAGTARRTEADSPLERLSHKYINTPHCWEFNTLAGNLVQESLSKGNN